MNHDIWKTLAPSARGTRIIGSRTSVWRRPGYAKGAEVRCWEQIVVERPHRVNGDIKSFSLTISSIQ